MRKMQPFCSPAIVGLVFIGLGFSSMAHGQKTPPQRGLQPADPPLASTPASPAGPYYALVIGNNQYKYFPKLETAVNDATAVAQLLQDRYGFHVKLLTNATRKNVMDALAEYRSRLAESSSLLIYYAGHGYNDRAEDEAYWIPVDAQKNSQGNWISAADITHTARAMAARHVLIISDSCYSGVLTRDIDTAVRLDERGTFLKKMLSSKSRTLMSSGGDEPVADAGGEGHSVFAGALLQALNEMEEDQFAAEDLFHRKILERVGGQSAQVPEYKTIRDSGHVAGDFVFFRSRTGVSKVDASGSVVEKNVLAPRHELTEQQLRSLAEAGDAEAARKLGSMYENGLGGLPKDDAQAASWYRKAADAGDGRSMNALGFMYAHGRGGLPQDHTQAVIWYRKAAEAGDSSGMTNLGLMYEKGLGGLPKDDAQAVSWYRKGAEAGNAVGMDNLGVMYEKGLGGLPKDDAQAVSWYRKSAEAGEGRGMNNLGHMYEQGRGGLRKDKAQAVNWYRKAADKGIEQARNNLQRLGY